MSKNKQYAIVDIETTGGRASRHRITEIGIVLFDGEQVTDTFESLINPERLIPSGITRLTGITDEMVRDAPRFHEVARKIVEMTEGAVFVAHNVHFDYDFLREEFKRLGYTFSRRKLCTVRLSRKVFPGLPSYSLGNLIKHFGIKVDARHRALADAMATTELLEMALKQQNSTDEVKLLVNMGIKETRLPKHMKIEQIEKIPEETGVYYFHDAAGDVIYVGKSNNIRKRVAQHFADPTKKGEDIRKQVADITFEITGSELVALLLESQEIKRLLPSINRAQRGKRFSYAINAYLDDKGYRCFNVIRNTAQARKEHDIISEYPSMTAAKGRLDYVRKQLELCSSLTNLFPSRSACFHYHLKQCRGACIEKESPEVYNERAEMAYTYLRTVFDEDFFLIDVGRTKEEKSVVLVREGKYQGFGFLSEDEAHDIDSIERSLRTCNAYPDTARIIQRFLIDKPAVKMVRLGNA